MNTSFKIISFYLRYLLTPSVCELTKFPSQDPLWPKIHWQLGRRRAESIWLSFLIKLPLFPSFFLLNGIWTNPFFSACCFLSLNRCLIKKKSINWSGSWGRGETAAGSLPGFSNAKITTQNQPETELAQSICRHKCLNCPHGPALHTWTFCTNSIKCSSAFQYFPTCQYKEMCAHKNLCLLSSLFIYSHYFSGSAVFCDLTAQSYNKWQWWAPLCISMCRGFKLDLDWNLTGFPPILNRERPLGGLWIPKIFPRGS